MRAVMSHTVTPLLLPSWSDFITLLLLMNDTSRSSICSYLISARYWFLSLYVKQQSISQFLFYIDFVFVILKKTLILICTYYIIVSSIIYELRPWQDLYPSPGRRHTPGALFRFSKRFKD